MIIKNIKRFGLSLFENRWIDGKDEHLCAILGTNSIDKNKSGILPVL